jgi:hypothetical protein
MAGQRELFMSGIHWTFSDKHYASEAEFVAAVNAHARELGREAKWDPKAIVVPERQVELQFSSVIDGAADDTWAKIETDSPEGFTAGALLWRTHEKLTNYNHGDERIFEGFQLWRTSAERKGKPPLYMVEKRS